MRYLAPADVSAAILTNIIAEVVDGAIEVPDDASDNDRMGLAANGFTLAVAEPVVPPEEAEEA